MNAKLIFTMKYSSLLLIGAISLASTLSTFSQDNDISKRNERKKNLTVKEWNTRGTKRYLDHVTVYNELGKKIEETEFAAYGMRERVTSEYNAQGHCIKQIVYNDRNKVSRIRKIEYNPDGSRKSQYNYFPNGKLESVKIYEYFSDNSN